MVLQMPNMIFTKPKESAPRRAKSCSTVFMPRAMRVGLPFFILPLRLSYALVSRAAATTPAARAFFVTSLLRGRVMDGRGPSVFESGI
jgi:hypothetical protein